MFYLVPPNDRIDYDDNKQVGESLIHHSPKDVIYGIENVSKAAPEFVVKKVSKNLNPEAKWDSRPEFVACA